MVITGHHQYLISLIRGIGVDGDRLYRSRTGIHPANFSSLQRQRPSLP
jgi:hypothetical protein